MNSGWGWKCLQKVKIRRVWKRRSGLFWRPCFMFILPTLALVDWEDWCVWYYQHNERKKASGLQLVFLDLTYMGWRTLLGMMGNVVTKTRQCPHPPLARTHRDACCSFYLCCRSSLGPCCTYKFRGPQNHLNWGCPGLFLEKKKKIIR